MSAADQFEGVSISRELVRKSFHLAFVWIPLTCYYVPRGTALLLLAIAAIGMLLLDVARLKEYAIHPLMRRFWGMVLRGHERRTLSGATYMMVSSFVVLMLWGRIPATIATLYLIIGDSAAALIGKRWGVRTLFNKTYVGSAACFVACLLLGIMLPQIHWSIALAGAALATFAEVIPLPLDDNISVPLFAGMVVWLLM